MERIVQILVTDLDHVMAISSTSTFTSITSLTVTSIVAVIVSIRPSPLNVDVVVLAQMKELWHEVVLDSRVRLDDVASLALDHEVVNRCGPRDPSRARVNTKDMRAVLEGSASLGSVDGQSQALLDTDVDSWVLTNRGILAIER